MEAKYTYNICTVADREIYKKQKRALTKHIPTLREVEELEDVDGSLFCEMAGAYGRLVLKNSEYVDALWIESDFDIDPFFE